MYLLCIYNFKLTQQGTFKVLIITTEDDYYNTFKSEVNVR